MCPYFLVFGIFIPAGAIHRCAIFFEFSPFPISLSYDQLSSHSPAGHSCLFTGVDCYLQMPYKVQSWRNWEKRTGEGGGGGGVHEEMGAWG